MSLTHESKFHVCEVKGCRKKARCIAFDRVARTLGTYCVEHGEQIAQRGGPEYDVQCPACNCHFGVG
jgi:hypothetical protein